MIQDGPKFTSNVREAFDLWEPDCQKVAFECAHACCRTLPHCWAAAAFQLFFRVRHPLSWHAIWVARNSANSEQSMRMPRSSAGWRHLESTRSSLEKHPSTETRPQAFYGPARDSALYSPLVPLYFRW